MNWYTLSLIAGIVFVIVGIVVLTTGETIAGVMFLAVGAAFLALDLDPSHQGEFSGLSKELLIKKLLGVVALVAAFVIFILEVGRNLGWF